MSLLRTLDRTSAVSNIAHAHARPVLGFLYPAFPLKAAKRDFSRSSITHTPRFARAGEHGDIFIRALVLAGSCSEHTSLTSTLFKTARKSSSHHKPRRKSTWHGPEKRGFQTGARASGPFKKFKNFAEKELSALVDYYGIQLDQRPNEDPEDDGSLVWNVGDSHQPWPLREWTDAVHINRLKKLLLNDEASHDDVFETYKKLPTPGVVYLDIDTIRALLHHLAIVERPTPIAMQRYLSVLDDMKTAHIHIKRSEWTSAIHLTGRAMGQVSADDVQSALHVWHDMEHRAGLKGGYVTLNVLFNVAIKAEKYSLAETFIKEMQTRRLKPHRHYRVSLLYYHGVLQDGNAVRRAYQDLVAAGDIVDTVVLNAVIAALIRAGEPSAAEHVFERMKRLNAERRVSAPGHRFFNRTWRDRRALGLHLTYESRKLKKQGGMEQLKELQDYAPVAPNSRTYALLIRHQASTAGNIDRVTELMQEMRHNSVPFEGTIFTVIFHGFNSFGGVRYSSWTRDKLERFWTQYLQALNQNLERMWLSRMVVVAALRAFAKCTDPERTLGVWEEMRELWHPSEEELEDVMRALRKLVPSQAPGFFDENPDRKI